MGRRLVRALLFVGPLLVGIAGVLAFATDRGGYMATWNLTIAALNGLTPEFPRLEPDNRVWMISMHQINNALRRVAHVLTYASMALLLVRTLQWGRPRLRARAVLGMLFICGLLTGAESLVRLKLSNERHVRWEQVLLNLIGVGVAFALTLIFFGVKALERRTQKREPPPTE